MKYSQILIDDEYESSNIASQNELGSISGNINLKHTSYTHWSATVRRKILTMENIDKYDEFSAIRQYFLYQNFPFS